MILVLISVNDVNDCLNLTKKKRRVKSKFKSVYYIVISTETKKG